MQNKSLLSLALATVYRPPGPYKDFLKEFADFLSDLLVNVDKALIVRYFTFTFTFMHLADAFIQSDLQCIQAMHFFLSVCVFPGN